MRKFVALFAAVLFAATPPAQAYLDGGSHTNGDNITLPDFRQNLDTGLINVKDFGAKGDTVRLLCSVTTVATNTTITISVGDSGCTFTSADAGKNVVVMNAGSSATSPLATKISSVTDSTHIVVASAPGQTLTGSSQYVTWGTDNQSAINNAYIQAAMQTLGGQQGLVYFPPLPTPQVNSSRKKCWGVASPINTAPSNFQIGTMGAGKFATNVCALAAMAELVNGASSFSKGGTVRDISFDGNQLATDVGLFTCLPDGYISNVQFANPAAGGHAFKISTGAGCNTAETFGVYASADANLYTNSAQYPDVLVDIANTDTQHYGMIVSGQAATASIQIESTGGNAVLFGPHVFGSDGTYGIRALTYAAIYYPQIDYGTGPTVGLDLANTLHDHMSVVHGGRGNAPTTNKGVQVEANAYPTEVTGFDCTGFTTCISEASPDNRNLIFGNFGASQVPQYAEVLAQAPTGPTTTSQVFMGLNLTITPQSTSGVLWAQLQGAVKNATAGDGAQVELAFGTGTVPTNAQACSTGGGTTLLATGSPETAVSGAANQWVPLSNNRKLAVSKGTTYWVDICAAQFTGGTVTFAGIDLKVKEDGLRQ